MNEQLQQQGCVHSEQGPHVAVALAIGALALWTRLALRKRQRRKLVTRRFFRLTFDKAAFKQARALIVLAPAGS